MNTPLNNGRQGRKFCPNVDAEEVEMQSNQAAQTSHTSSGVNLINRVILRETRGSLQTSRRRRHIRFFNKIPVRSVFRLSALVSEHILRDGHVFLGFTKSGQFVLSYSVRVETFEPHLDLPLVVYTLHWWHFLPHKKLRKVAESRLFGEQDCLRDNLFIAFCEWPRDDSKVFVYGYSSRTDADEKRDCYVTITAVPSPTFCPDCRALDNIDSDSPSGLCLRHGFAVHTKYELAAPYPLLFPKTHLRLDGVAVLNTGDSLVALNAELEKAGTPDTGLMANTQPASDCDIIQNDHDPNTPSAASNSDEFQKDSDFADNFSPPPPPPPAPKSYDKSIYDFCEDQNFPQPMCAVRNYPPCPTDKIFEKPIGSPPFSETHKENFKFSKHSSPECSKSESRLPFSDVMSPCFIKIDDGTCSTASSCYSSPVIYQNESQSFTYSIRKYAEADGPVDAEPEDDLSVAYHSVLPLEVHGSSYNPMSVLTSRAHNPPGSKLVVVKQLTFDVEQYIAEVLRTSADIGHRYASFTDYDAQILDVCPDTSRVIGMVAVLVRARPPLKTKMDPQRYTFKLYQTRFTFVWNLNTGAYQTIDSDEFTEIERPKIAPPGAEIAHTMYKRFSVPESYSLSVHYLTNDSVFREESLKALIDPQHYVAIVL